MRGTLVAQRAAQVQLLGRKRLRGRRPMAAPAWERMEFEIQTPLLSYWVLLLQISLLTSSLNDHFILTS
jgi:hypothetical protein